MDVKLIVASHKDCPVPEDGIYFPIQLGAELNKERFGFTPDNTGDHISAKNPVFCELTGLYWAWKNLDCDWLGLVHYRRYFACPGKKKAKKSTDPFSCVLNRRELEPLLKKYKIIVPAKRHYYIETVYSHYSHTFDGTQLDKAREVLSERHSEYLSAFDTVMSQRSAYVFNMFIMPRKLMEEYCTWLFDILFELEKRIDTSGMTAFEKRYAGRVSERLFNVWLEHRLSIRAIDKKEIYELPYIYLEKIHWGKKITGFLKAKFFGEKYRGSF